MTKFTPGPWVFCGDKESGAIWIEDDTLGTMGVCDLYHKVGDKVVVKNNAIKNAHLIAAAPDLYETLEGLLQSCCNHNPYYIDGDDNAGEKARQALKKARGE